MDKDQLVKRADELMAFILQGLEQGKEFAAEQMPLLIQEVIKWGIVEHSIYLVVCVVVLVTALCVFRYAYNQHDPKDYHKEWPIGFMVITFFVSTVSFACAAYNSILIAQAYYAPRVYLLTVLKTLLK